MSDDSARKVRVVVVDDSAYNRQTIISMLESHPEIEVVGRSANGEEALRDVLRLRPDVLTLDLEMPRMDGFTFLRIVMSRRPTPVIVISSYSNKQNVFKALELGALDFIAKPTRHVSPELTAIRDELVSKVLLVRQLQGDMRPRSTPPAEPSSTPAPSSFPALGQTLGLVVLGASTGGPPALQMLFQTVAWDLPLAYLVAQHMPANFTRAFAERMNRSVGLDVREAADGEEVQAGRVYIAPGGRNLRVLRKGDRLLLEVVASATGAKYVPSIDELFSSAAEAWGSRVLGILLTGMGADGREGIRAVKRHGGVTVAESEETAVIFGMPREAIDTGQVDMVRRLDELPEEVRVFAERISADSQQD